MKSKSTRVPRILGAAAILALAAVTSAAQDIRVMTTTQDLADIAKRIGGDIVSVESLARGDQDLHRIRPRPQHLLKLRRADFLLEMGLDMEHAWLPALIEATHNKRIRPGGEGFVNCSVGIDPLEVPASLDRSQGVDFHPRGNPHFNIDPEGGRIMATNILKAFTASHPRNAAKFKKNYDAFIKELDEHIARWKTIAAPLKGRKFVCRHRSHPYLAKRYGFQIIADLEPKPGLEPTPSHVAEVMELIKKEHVCAIIVPPYLDDGISKRVSEETGCPLVVLPLGVTGRKPCETYFDFLDDVIKTLAATAEKQTETSK